MYFVWCSVFFLYMLHSFAVNDSNLVGVFLLIHRFGVASFVQHLFAGILILCSDIDILIQFLTGMKC